MSACTFLASDHPLPPVSPSREYPVEVKLNDGTVCDGGADDNFTLYPFAAVRDYTDKQYGVALEWYPTPGRALRILDYIRAALQDTDVVELWHVWLMGYYEYEERPVCHHYRTSLREITEKDIRELDGLAIWNHPDRRNPGRPSFYCLSISC